MREILFRGKRTDNGEWIYGNLFVPDIPDAPVEICTGTNRVRITYEVDPDTVGQYTGLTDKNGKPVFEGDIIRSEFSRRLYPVCFGEYYCVDEDGDEELACGWYCKEGSGYEIAFGDPDGWASVVGNIHDNPELLEVSE